MSQKIFSFLECFNDLNGKLYRKTVKSGLSRFEAQDVVQNVWVNVYKRLKQDQKLLHRFETEFGYSNNYIFKALINGIINEKKRRGKNNLELKKEMKYDFEDPIEIDQRNKTRQNFIKALKNELKDDEIQFIDLWLEVFEKNLSVKVSEVARLMGLTATKGHDIIRRIRRKATAFEEKNSMLKDVAAPAAIFDFGMFEFIKDIFRPQIILDKKLQKSGEKISNNVLSELGIEAISIFSKFVK